TIVAVLYWAQAVLLPVALAIFFAFLLNPLVRALQRRGLGRMPAVLVVVVWAALMFGAFGWLLTRQVSSMVARLPDYTANVKAEVKALKSQGGTVERLTNMFDEVSSELKSPESADQPPEKQPAVVVQPGVPAWLRGLPGYLGSAAELLGSF